MIFSRKRGEDTQRIAAEAAELRAEAEWDKKIKKAQERGEPIPQEVIDHDEEDKKFFAMRQARSEALRKAPAITGRDSKVESDVGPGGTGAGQTYVSDVARLEAGNIPVEAWDEANQAPYGTSDNPRTGGGAPDFWKGATAKTAVKHAAYEPSTESSVIEDEDGADIEKNEYDLSDDVSNDRYAHMANEAGVPDVEQQSDLPYSAVEQDQ